MTRPAVPWLLVVGAFVVAERCVVHLRIGRSAHTVSLADIPFVVGLVFVSPRMLLVATTVAIALLLLTERGLPMVKRVFNLAQYVLAASLAIAIFGALAPEGAPATDPAVWLAAARGHAVQRRARRAAHRRRHRADRRRRPARDRRRDAGDGRRGDAGQHDARDRRRA